VAKYIVKAEKLSSYEKQKRRGAIKLEQGIPLKKGEIAALNGEYFFSFCFDYSKYKEFVSSLGDESPNDVVWTLISKYMEWD